MASVSVIVSCFFQQLARLVFSFIVSQIVSAFLLAVGLIVFTFNWIVRLIFAFYLRVRYKGRIKLVWDSGDAMFGYTSDGNTRNMLVAIQVEQRIDPASARQTIRKNVLEYTRGSSKPYEKLKWIFKHQTYPYFCWQYDENFSLENHVLVMEDKKVVSQQDLHLLLSELRKDMSEDHPQWEFLLIPRFSHSSSSPLKIETTTSLPLPLKFSSTTSPPNHDNPSDPEERSCIVLRVHHGYMDGLSFVNLVSHALGVLAPTSLPPLSSPPTHQSTSSLVTPPLSPEQLGESPDTMTSSPGNSDTESMQTPTDTLPHSIPPPPLSPNPATYPYVLNPMTFSIPFRYRLIYNLNCIIFGGYHLLKTVISSSKHFLHLHTSYPGPHKFYDTCEDISSDMLRVIRTACQASVANIVGSCFLSALEKVVPSSLPECGKIGHTLAILPYPDETFHNRFTMMSVPFKRSHGLSRMEKVKEYQKKSNQALTGPEYYLYYWLFQFYGQLPSYFFKWVLKTPRFTFFVNNVPFAKQKLLIFNSLVYSMAGWPPYTTDAGLGITLIGYEKKLSFGATADSSWLTKDQLRRAVQEFEREIKLLAQECAEFQA